MTLGSLSDMTPSEQSVGAALTKMTVQAVAANPDSATAQALNSVFYQERSYQQELYQSCDQRGPGAAA
jgi:hypothetical protein